MTPSKYIEQSSETIWKEIGKASSKLVLALVRRRIKRTTITDVIYALEAALAEAKALAKFMDRIKEN